MCGGQEMRDESERHILSVKVFTPRLTSSGNPHKMKKNKYLWYFKNHKYTSASGHDKTTDDGLALLTKQLWNWTKYTEHLTIWRILKLTKKILNSWYFRHWAGSTGFWSLSKETHVISPTVALAFCWSLFWSWHRMVELKLNANLNKLRGQTLESQATEIAGHCRARK